MCAHFSHVQPLSTLWTAARQALLSMGFSRQEYWSGLPCPPPGDLPNPGIALQTNSWPLSHWRSPIYFIESVNSVYMSIPVHPTSSLAPWNPYICSLPLYLYFCLAKRFLCTIFLYYTYVQLIYDIHFSLFDLLHSILTVSRSIRVSANDTASFLLMAE